MSSDAVRPASDTTAVILAGGRSVRFGGDKLAAIVGGRALLARVVDAVSQVCAEVVIVGRGAAPDAGLATTVRHTPDTTPHAGPLAALLDGARAARHPILLVVAGDMPELAPAVLAELVLEVRSGADGAVLVQGGDPQLLPMGVRRDAALRAAGHALETGARSLRDLIGQLGPIGIDEARWRVHDPLGRTLRDIDRPEDLVQGRPGPPSA